LYKIAPKEGIEWTMKYYRGLEYEKGWVYKSSKGPLLCEMSSSSSSSSSSIRIKKEKEWINAKVQLAYVLPKSAHKMMGKEVAEYLKENHRELYPSRYKLEWEYIRYEWEAEPIIPEISLEQLMSWKNNKIFQ